MARHDTLQRLAELIASVERPHTARVGIDGIDSAGKTTLADELVPYIENLGRPVIRASVDGFHRPRVQRYNRGEESPEGFYYDSYDYDSVREELLEQLGPGGAGRYRTATFDLNSDSFIYEPLRTAPPGSVLLFDGIFLFRQELNDLWDYRIFVHIESEEALARAKVRDLKPSGSIEAVEKRYRARYMPGQQIYLSEVNPRELADVVLDNSDVYNPSLTQ